VAKRGEPFSMFEAGRPGTKLLIIGEAPGEDEDKAGRPFIGPSGQLLDVLLNDAGFHRSDFNITNVFTRRPPDNDLKKNWTLTKTELKKLGYSTVGRLPPMNKRYIHPEHESEVARLHEEIRQLDPTFILMLGGTALWAISGEARITVNRGNLLPLGPAALALDLTSEEASTVSLPSPASCQTSSPSSPPPPQPTPNPTSCPASQSPLPPTASPKSTLATTPSLPQWAQQSNRWGLATFHPAMVLRQWDNKPLVWADLTKCRRFLSGTLPAPLARRFWISPTLEDLSKAYSEISSRPVNEYLGVDIETDPRIGQITTISFGFPDLAVCIPFYNRNTLPNLCNYWKTAADEREAWKWVMRFAALPHPKVGQNFLYDDQYLLDPLDIRMRNMSDDTAILQHALQPELPKALGTLASLYINEPSWKFMRESSKDDNKADE